MNSSINEESSHSHIVDDSSDLPLTIGITSDGANVLRGKKNGIQKKIKNVANQLMLSSHCILHRFELSTKSVMEKNNRSLKDLFQFLEKLLKYHHNCTVVTAVFRKTVKVYDITGATSVIRMNETRSISHVTLALKTSSMHIMPMFKQTSCNKLKNIQLFQNHNLFIFLISRVTDSS